MRRVSCANFTKQSVRILFPVMVFLSPFVVFSAVMQWHFATKDSSNFILTLFFRLFSFVFSLCGSGEAACDVTHI
jgi:hypothetical protein